MSVRFRRSVFTKDERVGGRRWEERGEESEGFGALKDE